MTSDCRRDIHQLNLKGVFMNQRESILKSNAPTQVVAGTKYKGRAPVFKDLNANITGAMPNWQKVSAGVPFVRI